MVGGLKADLTALEIRNPMALVVVGFSSDWSAGGCGGNTTEKIAYFG